MAEIRVVAGKRDVVASGSVVVLPKETATIHIDNVAVEFRFTEDAAKSVTIDADIDSVRNILRLKLVNFSNPIGTAWESEIGTLYGRKLFVAIYTAGVGDKLKSRFHFMAYTFSLGGAAQ